MYNISRPATQEEIRIYQYVNAYARKLDDDDFEKFLKIIGDYAWEYRKLERRKAYHKIYYLARKVGVFVSDLETWYWTEEM